MLDLAPILVFRLFQYESTKDKGLNFLKTFLDYSKPQFLHFNCSTSKHKPKYKLEKWFIISGNGVRPYVHTFVRPYVTYVSKKHIDQRFKPFFNHALIGAWVWIIVRLKSSYTLSFFKVSSKSTIDNDIRELIQKSYHALGPMSFHEASVFFLFVSLVLLWFFRDPKFMTGWGNFVKVE